MKRLIYLLLLILIQTDNISAQQFPLFTNYVVNGFGFNPAIIGTQKGMELRGIHRSQWIGVEGRPQTSIMSLTGRFKKLPIAVGTMLYNDLQGTMRKDGVNLLLAYNQRIDDKTSISVGFSGGYFKMNLRDDVFAKDEPDGVIDGAKLGIWIPDLSAGVFFKQENGLFAGISVPQLYRKDIFFDPTVQRINTTQIVRQYHGIIGYRLKVNDKMALEPSGLIKVSPNLPPQYDMSMRAIINNKFWIGGSFRSEDAITGMVGIDMERWMLAYSYDVTTSRLRSNSSGSHEIVFALRMSNNKCKDQDKDGICDKEDKCPTEPGTKETDGCPLPKPEEKKDCTDKDRDGVCDKDDQCPELPGPKDNRGCPTNDRDGDGIRDDIDKCPDIPGNLKNEGCPLSDRDRDGILDEIDPCPDVPGTLENMGCPPETDRDKDGTPDKDDNCPDISGPKDNKGCPKDGDRDKDGVPDSVDDCPNTAGPKENNGCPNVTQDERDLITLVIQNLYFDSDKYVIRPSSYRNLNNLALLLKKKKDWKIKIEGHADSRGNKEHNIRLSQNRADAVKNYLVSRGVPPNLIYTDFYGDSKPATTEKDKSGLQMNRRVEIEFVFN